MLLVNGDGLSTQSIEVSCLRRSVAEVEFAASFPETLS